MEQNVFVWGTFDIFHGGHIFFLKEAGKLGKVYAIVIPDSQSAKSSRVNSQGTRAAEVLKSGLVADVFIDSFDTGLACFKKVRPDLFYFGHDQSSPWDQALVEYLNTCYPECKVTRYPTAERIARSSDLKEVINCPCDSGKKWKKCGLLNTAEHQQFLHKK